MNTWLFFGLCVLFVVCNLLFYRWGYRNGRKDEYREWQD